MLSMTCLGGSHIGKSISLFEGQRLSGEPTADLEIPDLKQGHYIIELNSDGLLMISAKDSAPPLESAGESLESLVLIPGLMFTLMGSTFAVQEDEADEVTASKIQDNNKTFEDLTKELLEGPECDGSLESVSLLEKPVKLDFVRGFWMNQSWTLQHSPIHMGRQSPLYFFQDDSIDTKDNFLTLKYDRKKKTLHLSTPFESLIFINGSSISSQEVFDGDFVEFGTTAFYINIDE